MSKVGKTKAELEIATKRK